MTAYAVESLSIVAAFGCTGAAIDFVIGRLGQKQTRDFLETWWIRFDDMPWRSFGSEEAKATIALIDYFCGRSIFSIRRLGFVLSCIVIILIYAVTATFIHESANPYLASFGLSRLSQILPSSQELDYSYLFARSTMMFLGLLLSVSLTRRIASVSSMMSGPFLNIIAVVVTIAIHYCLLAVWPSILTAAYTSAFEFMKNITGGMYYDFNGGGWRKYFDGSWAGLRGAAINSWYTFAGLGNWRLQDQLPDLLHPTIVLDKVISALSPQDEYGGFSNIENLLFGVPAYGANLLRLLVLMIFSCLYLMRPLAFEPMSLVWRRIVESDTPIFTLVFGGVGSLAVLIKEIIAVF
jgi:hypothetical protein